MRLPFALLSVLALSGAAPAIRLVPAFPALTFDRPLDLQAQGDQLYVVEQRGVIKRFSAARPSSASVFLDLRDRVNSEGNEEGLLGLAFDKQGQAYVNYTAARPRRTVISRFNGAKEEVLLTFNQPYANHNGGCLAFGPDGYLYVGTGDGGYRDDPHGNGQNRKSLLGKILRLDVNQPGRYRIPKDNPLAGNQHGYRDELYAWGLRNPWRFAFDRESGLLYCADVGQDRIEEVDLIQRGKNYGWNVMEGSECFKTASCDKRGLVPPIAEYGHDQGQSITGGRVYRGKRIPALYGAYLYADFVSGRIWQLRHENGVTRDRRVLLDSGLNISSFGEDAQRELYVTAFDGKIYRFE